MTSLLILDDDPDCGALIAKFAARLGKSAAYFSDPTAFVAAAIAGGRDVDVIVDMQMPRLDGIDVIEQLFEKNFDGRIFLMSGGGRSMLEAGRRVLGGSEGLISGVLPKPFGQNDLKRLLEGEGKVRPTLWETPVFSKADPEPQFDVDSLFENLCPAFQPKIAAGSRRIVGYEVLARLDKADGSALGAEELLGRLKMAGRSDDATWQLSRKAIDWSIENLASDQSLAINFEPDTISNIDLVDQVCAYALDSGLEPEQFVFEITEHQNLPRRLDILRKITKLRTKGFGVAIDDFGVGFSSLQQLSSFPFSEIKIDREFVSRMLEDPIALSVVRAAIQMGSSAGMSCTAEGVEDEETALALEAMGCSALQGFWVSKPLMSEEASAFAMSYQPPANVCEAEQGDGGPDKAAGGYHVAIVDDEAAVRQTLVRGLSRLGFSCRPFCSGKDFLESLESEHFDCCLLDFRMPQIDGLDTLKAIPSNHRGMPVLIFTSHADLKLAVDVMSEGAVDLIEKPSTMKAIAERINERVIASRGLRFKLRLATESKKSLENLTPREREVAALTAEGKSSKEVALVLGLSHRTVEVHRANILKKTNTRNATELTRLYEQASFSD
ncbi:EAL domain-containing protein [Erythrobacter gaetbuli]|uniref:EAL domain-containing protein n=1 Tax=Qipengyuania gaetbuli TaxID=266952 RepID=A0A844XYA7_9SPHN|nr:EAL domain-containing protein [Qipengyuania gaetbuli]MXO50985.1 EAL domain-containing protein [Qipengyuania gaetbuli]